MSELAADVPPPGPVGDHGEHAALDLRERRRQQSAGHVYRRATSRSRSHVAETPSQVDCLLACGDRLGEGAFGEVFRAWDPRLEREVALKLLKAAGGKSPIASNVIAEGRLLAKLRHPNVVTVHGAEVHGERVGVWMEFVRGRSLEQILRDHGPFGAREAGLIGIDVCRALAAVHRAGVIHRDVKAQNAMREEGGRIVLMDFGAGIEASDAESTRNISGTPLYMAPELLRGETATTRSDIYSLGVLLHRLVSGTFPIEASSWSELRQKHARRESRLLRDERPDLPEAFVRVVERATAWVPEERFATAGEMQRALSQALGVEEHRARRPPGTRVIAGGAVLVSAAVVAVLLMTGDRQDRTTTPTLNEKSAAPAEPEVPAAYTVEAGLFRAPRGGVRERIEPGAQLALGDRLSLEIQASTPLHVYVINEDDAGRAFALFPLPGIEPGNPLPPNVRHVLPGQRDGKSMSWTVDTPGGQEHLMVLASPTRLIEFEVEMNGLARPGQSAVSIPESAKSRLRGIGSLEESPAAVEGQPATRLFELVEQLAAGSETVRGVWMRRIDLANPQR
ncbi:MAG: serine/threonine-protein kinase [Candidatus Eiseniibacteriota bacterium]